MTYFISLFTIVKSINTYSWPAPHQNLMICKNCRPVRIRTSNKGFGDLGDSHFTTGLNVKFLPVILPNFHLFLYS